MMEALVCHPLDTIKVRIQLSRRAELAAATEDLDGDEYALNIADASNPLFADSQANSVPAVKGGGSVKTFRFRYNPPADVRKRQFCTMAKQYGYDDVAEFALVVEGWSQQQRRDFLDGFYQERRRALKKNGA